MNYVSLVWQPNLIQLLTSYNSKYDQNNNANQQLEEIFKYFVKIYSSRLQQHEIQYILISSKISTIYQERVQQEQQLKLTALNLVDIKEQREQLLQNLDQRELELTKIEKVLKSSNKRESIQNKFEDLQDGIVMCKEKCQLLQEENLEFTKLASSLKQQNDQLKNLYKQGGQSYDNNVEKLNELQQQGLNLNYRVMKQIKIIKDLGQLNQSGGNQKGKLRLEKFIHVQHNQIHFEPLEDLYNNLETQEQNNSDNYKELIESISQIISIKRELVQFNIKESSSNSPRQCDIEKVDPTLISGAFRFKTHHNLGEKLMRLRQISKQENDFRAFSELNDDDEVLQQSSEEDDNLPEQISHKQPWYIRSAIPIMSCKNSEKKQEVYSERKKHTKNKNSFASITSYTSFNKFGVTTLRDEFLNIYQNQQFDEYIKEKDTEMNDSDEIPQLIQQESIIEDSTIIIDRKQQQLSKSKIHIEIIQESVKYEPFRNLQIAGILLATCGIAGWLYKKYF